MKLPRATWMLPVSLSACGLGFWLWYSPGPRALHYSVVKGDTLWKIASAHGVTVRQIKEWNDLDGDLIQVGQVLLIREDSAAGRAGTGSGEGRRRPVSVASRDVVPVESGLRAFAPLEMPPEQPCIPPPKLEDLGDTGEEPEYMSSRGLPPDVIRSRMNSFLPELWRCVPQGMIPTGRVSLELTVACTGRVDIVEVMDSRGLDGALVSCVADTLHYVAFPPHDMPDGYVFMYPIYFSADP